MPEGLFEGVGTYYSQKLARHGPCALGVDWNCELTQQLRFIHLLKACDFGSSFSINDLGCGYGALASFLKERHPKTAIAYRGVDLSPTMAAAAQRLHAGHPWATFEVGRELGHAADYSVASGIFNVKLGQPLQTWERFVEAALVNLDRCSRTAFAVNFLLPLTDAVAPDELYCTGPEPWAKYCERRLGRNVEVLSRYGLTEFTLIVRRTKPGV